MIIYVLSCAFISIHLKWLILKSKPVLYVKQIHVNKSYAYSFLNLINKIVMQWNSNKLWLIYAVLFSKKALWTPQSSEKLSVLLIICEFANNFITRGISKGGRDNRGIISVIEHCVHLRIRTRKQVTSFRKRSTFV